jgi:hypothetical protein
MKANPRTCKRLLLIAILSCAITSVSAHASTISFFYDEKGGDVLIDLNEIETLDPSTWAVVELGKKADGGFEEFKLTGKKIKAKGNTPLTNMQAYDWTYELENLLGNYFNDKITVNNAFENSTPVHNPIPATVWIFGTGLVTLIMIRRKFHSPIS